MIPILDDVLTHIMNDQLKILAIEDNPGDYTLLELTLKRANCLALNLVRVETLKEALHHLHRQQVDVILLDLSLPDVWGIDAVKKLNSYASDIPIIVLTGNEDENLAIEAIQAGAQDYLIKGEFNSSLTMRSIRYAVARKRALLKNKHQVTHQQDRELSFQNVIEQPSDGIIIIDNKGIIQFVNSAAAEIYGQSTHEIIGTKFDYPLNTQEAIEVEFNRPTSSKQTVSTEVRIVQLRGQGENAFLASLRDISKWKNKTLKFQSSKESFHQST